MKLDPRINWASGRFHGQHVSGTTSLPTSLSKEQNHVQLLQPEVLIAGTRNGLGSVRMASKSRCGHCLLEFMVFCKNRNRNRNCWSYRSFEGKREDGLGGSLYHPIPSMKCIISLCVLGVLRPLRCLKLFLSFSFFSLLESLSPFCGIPKQLWTRGNPQISEMLFLWL